MGEGEGDAELEGREGRDHGRAPLRDEVRHAPDVDVGRGERRRDGSLGHGQRDPGVRGLQRAAVVAAVAAHHHLTPAGRMRSPFRSCFFSSIVSWVHTIWPNDSW